MALFDWMKKKKGPTSPPKPKTRRFVRGPRPAPQHGAEIAQFRVLRTFHDNTLGRAYAKGREYNVHADEDDLNALLPKWVKEGKVEMM